MRRSLPVLFRKPDLIPAQKTVIEQVGVLRGENQLGVVGIGLAGVEQADDLVGE